MNADIKIPFSKKKTTLLFFGSLIFVAFGTWFLVDPEKFINLIFRNPITIRIIGIFSIAFFGMCGVFIFKKLFSKKNGLIIGNIGITDNSKATSIGLVKWTDITGIRALKVVSQKFIMIDVSNPEHYIELKNNRIGKMAMKANYKKYGSPISITTNSLKLNFDEIKKTIEKQYEKNVLHNQI